MSNQIDRLKHSQRTTTRKSLVKLTVCMAVIGGLASYVRYKARKAERIHPPKGKFRINTQACEQIPGNCL